MDVDVDVDPVRYRWRIRRAREEVSHGGNPSDRQLTSTVRIECRHTAVDGRKEGARSRRASAEDAVTRARLAMPEQSRAEQSKAEVEVDLCSP